MDIYPTGQWFPTKALAQMSKHLAQDWSYQKCEATIVLLCAMNQIHASSPQITMVGAILLWLPCSVPDNTDTHHKCNSTLALFHCSGSPHGGVSALDSDHHLGISIWVQWRWKDMISHVLEAAAMLEKTTWPMKVLRSSWNLNHYLWWEVVVSFEGQEIPHRAHNYLAAPSRRFEQLHCSARNSL